MRVSANPSPYFRLGDEVFDPVDPRHVGKVRYTEGHSVHLLVRVQWENGLVSDIVYRPGPRPNLVRVAVPMAWIAGAHRPVTQS